MNRINSHDQSIILFDGICHLCSGIVFFVIRRDPKRKFKFASLQSAAGRRLLQQYGLPDNEWQTFVLIRGGRRYTKSTAALLAAQRLTSLWPLLYPLILIPKPLRDLVYDWIARNRYRWFGQKAQCMIPTPEVRDRFLE